MIAKEERSLRSLPLPAIWARLASGSEHVQTAARVDFSATYACQRKA